jgi:hypothetical protein
VQAAPRSQRPEASPICGLDIAKASGAKVLVREPASTEADCFYAWQHGVIVLSPEVAIGTDVGSLIAASEEVAHHRQPKWLHALQFLSPARWFAEADAFLRVKRAFGLNC